MGTYTANYQLYMPSIGEQGWGDLMNGNLTTIDTTMAGLNTRVGTLETETDAVAQRVGTLEGKVSAGGNISPSTINADNIICDVLKTNKLYLPFSTTYTIKLLEPVNKMYSNFQYSSRAGTINWGSITASDLYTLLSSVISISDDTTFLVKFTLTADGQGSSDKHSFSVAVNGTNVYQSPQVAPSAGAQTYECIVSRSDTLSGTIYRYSYAVKGTSTLTISINPMGI